VTLAYIIGGGGHARVIASMIDADPVFVVPQTTDGGTGQMTQAAFFASPPKGAAVYIGIGNNDARRRLFEQVKSVGLQVTTLVAPNAFVARDAELGEGALICLGSIVGSRARIGANAIVNTLSSVDHDCVLGDHSQVTAGVTFGGTVRTGELCFFGDKSAVIPNRTIGRNVQVMAGALVAADVGDNVVVGGSPARVVRSLA
jgi:sugar O-acyltransferase (sialic acid O-acetyltransferase NeuD family)